MTYKMTRIAFGVVILVALLVVAAVDMGDRMPVTQQLVSTGIWDQRGTEVSWHNSKVLFQNRI